MKKSKIERLKEKATLEEPMNVYNQKKRALNICTDRYQIHDNTKEGGIRIIHTTSQTKINDHASADHTKATFTSFGLYDQFLSPSFV